jgi:hypothetical protein
MRYLSCAPTQLYRMGGFFEQELLLQELKAGELYSRSVRQIAELFPPYEYVRRPPATLATETPLFAQDLAHHYEEINRAYGRGAACMLIEISSAAIANSVVYTRSLLRNSIIYESYRPNERPYASLIVDLDSQLSERVHDLTDNNAQFLLIGSVGAFNYGHWLVDDLAKLKAADILRPRLAGRKLSILVPSYSSAMDRVCMDSIRHFLDEGDWYNIRLINPAHLHRFGHLYYVTPVSYHPVQKNPEALQYLAQRIRSRENKSSRGQPVGRVFVMRRAERGRALTNANSIYEIVRSYGFEIVDPETLSYAEQLSTFTGAGLVVGPMGAAMVNTLFCAPGADVVYLIPEGWVEPFYWDLAEVLGHTYHACYGPTDQTGNPPHQSAFAIPENTFRAMLDRILTLHS